MRHNCRKCRWERCRAAGAQLQVSVLPVPRKEESLVWLSPQPTITRLAPLFKLEHLMRGYDDFLAAQRALVVELHPELVGNDQQLVRVKKTLLALMEQKSLPLLFRFYSDHFGPLSKLGKQQKINLVMKSYSEFGIFHKAFLTSCFFPHVDDERLAIFNGYFGMFDFGRHGAEVCRPHWFFEGFVENEKIDTYVSVISPMMSRLYRQVRRFKSQGFRQFDVCGILLLIICKHLDNEHLMTDEMVAYKEELLAEWMERLRREFQPSEVITEFTKRMFFYYESDHVCREFNRAFTVLSAFWIRTDEHAYADVEREMQKLSSDVSPREKTTRDA
ncbi:hypothetical protein M3Y99_00934500 [Aphelenchoides fujianensis]|nr:hypothetical protein M3Y99_00934500 [Aphelenchoides fujianensis]